jgi:acetoin utilization deacetylase AcuC-like enzyme
MTSIVSRSLRRSKPEDSYLPGCLVYHPGYDLNFGPHVFPSVKFRLIREALLAEGTAHASDFIEPVRASDDELKLVHKADWVDRLKNGLLHFHEMMKLEIPYSHKMVEAFWLAAGGTTMAGRAALDHCVGFNIGGGFHHAFPDHGEGFCAIHDVAVAIRVLQREGRIATALVIDCDVHQGNGTASIFAGDDTVFTISLHQYNNYPSQKPLSNIDVDLEDEASDDEYVERLRRTYIPALDRFKPDLVMFVAGADPYFDDQLGGLALTMDGLERRDRLVIESARQRGIPVAISLAGGYARHLEDTVRIHCNTARLALKNAC